VDDIIFGSDDDRFSKNFSKDMQSEFEMSLLDELNLFLGLQISQLEEGIFISKTKYIKKMLKKFEMEDCTLVSTPMLSGFKLRKDDEYKEADHRLYRSMIGNLLYVIASRPDVMQVVGQFAIFQETPKETYVMAVNRIFKYLNGTTKFGLWYPKGNELTMVIYIDGGWVASIDDRRSTSGTTFYLGDCLVSWLSKKQSSISLSMVEA
jgi:hypothetical protein